MDQEKLKFRAKSLKKYKVIPPTRKEFRRRALIVKKYCENIALSNLVKQNNSRVPECSQNISSYSNNPSLVSASGYSKAVNNELFDNVNVNGINVIECTSKSENNEVLQNVEINANEDTSIIEINVSDSETSLSNFKNISYKMPLAQDLPKSSSEELNATFEHKLSDWAIQHKITHTALNDLLSLLKPSFPELPKDARTLLKTPRVTEIKNLNNGEYYHIKIRDCLKNLFNSFGIDNIKTTVALDFNFDGLPLFKSSSKSFWPILGRVQEVSNNPFLIGVFCGIGKPDTLEEYINDTILDIQDLVNNGFEYDGRIYNVTIRALICDAPARAYLKRIVSHTGYHSCEKCVIRGEYVTDKVTFPDCTCGLRTDDSFRNMLDKKHHSKDCPPSPLTLLPLGLVSQFPLEYMHLVCLGVTKRLLNTWVNGFPTKKYKQHRTVINKISENMLNLKDFIPDEFSRKPRPLKEMNRWKATEFRLFLLYVGPVVLKSQLPSPIYKNFMLFHVAIFILIQPVEFASKFYVFADNLLKTFVMHCIEVYGKTYISYNVHSLIHLVNDAKKFGPLDTFSSFPFENFLGQLKNMLRSSNKPLQQLARRYAELTCVSTGCCSSPFTFSSAHNAGPIIRELIGSNQYKKLEFKQFKLLLTKGDNCCCLSDGSIVVIQNFIQKQNEGIIIYKKFSTHADFFKYPCDSSKLGIKHVSDLSSTMSFASVLDIKCKCLLLPFSNGYASYPLYNLNL